MRVTARVLIVMLVFAALPATAQAHATLLTSTPEAESVVAQAPAQVTLTFDQAVQPVVGGTDVVDSHGDSVTRGAAHSDPANARILVVGLQPACPTATTPVRWRVVSTDGHLISGVLAFGVGKGGRHRRPRPPPRLPSTGRTWRPGTRTSPGFCW